MVKRYRRYGASGFGLCVSALVALLLAAPARAQEADSGAAAEPEGTGEPGMEAAEGGGEVEAEAYQFNLAPAKTAPDAVAEILLTPRDDGGYAAEMAAMSLPEPAALKSDATTYVVWIYDPANKKKQRVAALTPRAGAGTASFDVLWPKFALVVTAEPSTEPREWSGIAVLTGQPTVPENPGPATEAALAVPPAEPAPAAAASAAAEASQTAAPAAAASEAAEPSQAGPAAAASGAAEAGQPAGSAASEASPAAAPTEPQASQVATATPDAGVAGGTGAAAQPAGATAEAAAPECVNGPAEDTDKASKKKKHRFSNPALDAMAAAQREENKPACPPAER